MLEEDPDNLEEPMMEGSDEFSIVLGEERGYLRPRGDDENLDPLRWNSPPIQQYPSVLDSPAPIQQSPTTPPSLPTSWTSSLDCVDIQPFSSSVGPTFTVPD